MYTNLLETPLAPLSLPTTTRVFLIITFDCCVGITKERLGGRGIVDSAATAAQRDGREGGAAMGRRDGREGGGAETATM